MRLGTKIEAGAEFVQTQICFNLDKLRVFMARCGELGLLDHVSVLAGVFVPSSAMGARYLRDQVPGLDVPEQVIERMDSVRREAQREEGIRLALEIVEAVRQIPGVSGIHLMTINHEEAIPRVVEGAGLLPRPPAADVAIA
jgi:methylenetetrahydrofolate reductase (NADPH)